MARLSEAQRKALRTSLQSSLVDHWCRGWLPRTTLDALRRRGLVDTNEGRITDAGRSALSAEGEKGEGPR